MWSPRPNSIERFRATGGGNMGSVQDLSSPYRFGLRDRFVLVAIKGLFSGGSGSADMTIRLQHADRTGWSNDHDTIADSDGVYDFHEVIFEGAGTDGDAYIDYRVAVEEYPRYTYFAGDMLVPVWTNPNTQIWAIEFALAPAEQ